MKKGLEYIITGIMFCGIAMTCPQTLKQIPNPKKQEITVVKYTEKTVVGELSSEVLVFYQPARVKTPADVKEYLDSYYLAKRALLKTRIILAENNIVERALNGGYLSPAQTKLKLSQCLAQKKEPNFCLGELALASAPLDYHFRQGKQKLRYNTLPEAVDLAISQTELYRQPVAIFANSSQQEELEELVEKKDISQKPTFRFYHQKKN